MIRDARPPRRLPGTMVSLRTAKTVLAVVFAVLLFLATLTPQPHQLLYADPCLVCGDRGVADVILNILLFVPVGVLLGTLVGRRRALAAAVLLTATIEAAQLWIPGRHSSLGDLVFNATGAILGALLLSVLPLLVRPGRRLALVLGASWLVVVTLLLLGGLWLLQPVLPEASYYGQWTAELGSYEKYRGSVVSARLVQGAPTAGGDLAGRGRPLPSWRLEDSDAVRRDLRDGAALEVVALAGPAPGGIAPIFSIADAAERQILLLGADGEQIVYRHYTRAARLRFDTPDLRMDGALAPYRPGDELRLGVEPAIGGDGVRVNVNGRAETLRHGILNTWGLLLWSESIARRPALRVAAGTLWLIGLFFPALYWLGWAWAARGRD